MMRSKLTPCARILQQESTILLKEEPLKSCSPPVHVYSSLRKPECNEETIDVCLACRTMDLSEPSSRSRGLSAMLVRMTEC